MSENDRDAQDRPEGEAEDASPLASNQDSTSESDQKKVVPPLVAEEEKKKGNGLTCLAFLGLVAVVGAMLAPNFVRARARGQLTACKSNLKNLGTAMEMYSTDFSGMYPPTMDLLIPNYLKTIPECPAAGSVTYRLTTGSVAYNNPGFQDYYFFECAGPNHTSVSVPVNYPQYDGITGLVER